MPNPLRNRLYGWFAIWHSFWMFSRHLFLYIYTTLNCYVLEKVAKIHFLISTNQGPKFKGWVVAHLMMIMKPTKCGVNMMTHESLGHKTWWELSSNQEWRKSQFWAIFGWVYNITRKTQVETKWKIIVEKNEKSAWLRFTVQNAKVWFGPTKLKRT